MKNKKLKQNAFRVVIVVVFSADIANAVVVVLVDDVVICGVGKNSTHKTLLESEIADPRL